MIKRLKTITILAVAILLCNTLTVNANNNNLISQDELPVVLSSELSTNVVAFHGTTVPGYLEIKTSTNKLMSGYYIIKGEGINKKITLSLGKYYTTHHSEYWVPWNEVDNQPVPSGNYDVFAYFYDKEGNSIEGYHLGKVSVVEENNNQPLIEEVSANPFSITPNSRDTGIQTTVSFKVNQLLRMRIIIKKGNKIYSLYNYGIYEPGVHTWEWTGREQDNLLAPPGDYEIAFRYTELGYENDEKEISLGKLRMNEPTQDIPLEEMKKIIPEVMLDKNIISHDVNGVENEVNGTFTLTQPANVWIYAMSAANTSIENVYPSKYLEPGTYTFSWNGTNFHNIRVLDGIYWFEIGIKDTNGKFGEYYYKDAYVEVNRGNKIIIPKDVQYAKVITDTTRMYVYMAQPYTAYSGSSYPILEYKQNSLPGFAYRVKIAEGVTGLVDVKDVRLVTNDTVEKQWGRVNSDNIILREWPNHLQSGYNVKKGLKVQILRNDNGWYRVELDSGKQGYIHENDINNFDYEVNDIDDSSDYAILSVSQLSNMGIIRGDKNGNFKPRNSTSRAEIVKIIASSLNLDLDDIPKTPTFEDVPAYHWAYKYIEAANKAGIIKGVSPKHFSPSEKCTREQMAKIFVNAMVLPEEAFDIIGDTSVGIVKFDDYDTISDWAINSVKIAVYSELMKGTSLSSFDAKEYATKEQMAVLTTRFLSRKSAIEKEIDAVSSVKVVIDKQYLIFSFPKSINKDIKVYDIYDLHEMLIHQAADNESIYYYKTEGVEFGVIVDYKNSEYEFKPGKKYIVNFSFAFEDGLAKTVYVEKNITAVVEK